MEQRASAAAGSMEGVFQGKGPGGPGPAGGSAGCDCGAVPILKKFECIERNNVTFTKVECEIYQNAVWRDKPPVVSYSNASTPSKR